MRQVGLVVLCFIVMSISMPLSLTITHIADKDETRFLMLDVCSVADPIVSVSMDMPGVCEARYEPTDTLYFKTHDVSIHNLSGRLLDLTIDRPPRTALYF
ncbi:MAG: hypothetical protein HQL06_00310 [Nitrospirae bacterium]|nr:hypothetical protein [Nitrospirota bacterium]